MRDLPSLSTTAARLEQFSKWESQDRNEIGTGGPHVQRSGQSASPRKLGAENIVLVHDPTVSTQISASCWVTVSSLIQALSWVELRSNSISDGMQCQETKQDLDPVSVKNPALLT